MQVCSSQLTAGVLCQHEYAWELHCSGCVILWQVFSPYNGKAATTNDAILFVCSKYTEASKVFGHLIHTSKRMNAIALDNKILKQVLFILKKDSF